MLHDKDGPWAKLHRDPADQRVLGELSLLDHSLDVAAAFAALLDGGPWNRALALLAGRALTAVDVARLAAMAAFHDIGKANAGFQARRDPKAPMVGHEGEVAALLFHPELRTTAGGAALNAVLRSWGAGPYLSALFAHHGRPRAEFARATMAGLAPWTAHVPHWRPRNGYDPSAAAARLVEEVRARFPLAWAPGEKLPSDPRFVALFAGLLVLADWLGSDANRFPVGAPHGAARDTLRATQAAAVVAGEGLAALATPPGDFTAAFSFPPLGAQRDADADDLGAVALIEAETGSGKTEAALWRWLALRRRGLVDGLYFALPTRSAAVQLHNRVNCMLKRLCGAEAPRAVLAVPGYIRAGDAEGEALPGFSVAWDDEGTDGRWAAERTNRFLAARVAVGTIDQALLGALCVRHAPVRAAALARSLLVVDEVHASDAYMGTLLDGLLKNHVAAGGHALLLSATLGAAARVRLLGGPVPPLEEAVALPYPALSGSDAPLRAAATDGTHGKTVSVEIAPIMDDAAAIAARAVEAARAGASVLVVRNSVKGAIEVARAVEEIAPALAFRVNDAATLHHGRFAPSDRRLLDAAVEDAFGAGRSAAGRVLVGTQTLEQSLDIDADLLLTDLAPIDVLLQRIGRLHRHRRRKDRGAFADARVVVLRPEVRDLTRLLGRVRDRHGLGPMADGGGVYPDLRQIEATLALLEDNPVIAIPADNRRLVEGALHPDVLAAVGRKMEAAAEAAGGAAAWANHGAQLGGIASADRATAVQVALDLATPFSQLVFPDAAEQIKTRLGEQALLVDVALAGPFEAPVDRIAIPHWMAKDIGRDDKAELIGQDAAGERFRIGKRTFVYGRWGLERAD